MQFTAESVSEKRGKMKSRDLRQFDLFAIMMPLESSETETTQPSLEERTWVVESEVTQRDPAQSNVLQLRQPASATPPCNKRRQRPAKIQIIEERDLPEYTDPEKAIVDRTLEALPQTKAWFTYADIKQTFTISRATVVRRVRSGVVPGIRFAGDRVLEDGNIRRFTREQVRYLLLSIRRPAR